MSNKFDFGKVRERAVAKANQELEQGLEQMAEQGGGDQTQANPIQTTIPHPSGEPEVSAGTTSTSVGSPSLGREGEGSAVAEPTKGVQTYIPMSKYRRLNDIKLTRRENIADLAAQAINLWLDVQEGKLVVTKVE